jgi:hypothetical protein
MCLWITEHLITYSSINTGRKEPNDDDFLTGSNLISLRHWDIELSQCLTENGEAEMSDTKERIRRTGILQIVMILVVAASVNAGGIMDAARLITEQLWEHRYIPDSELPTVPLSEYDDFEVVELFRAETIEDLDAAIKEGYPMPWLEETLKDESIPWEDRYWLDRRVRAAIAQNTHTFFDVSGIPVHVEADGIFPGEMYWRENMIVDPEGWFAPEGIPRPTAVESWDIGLILNPYGRKIGEIAAAIPLAVFTSRDASTGVLITGGNCVYDPERQPYACFLKPDGSFNEIPLSYKGTYDVALSSDGGIAAFSLTRTHDREAVTYRGDDYTRDIEIYDGEGNLLRYIDTPINLDFNNSCAVVITQDGNYLYHQSEGVNTCLVNCFSGEVMMLPKPEWDRNTDMQSFSPDGRFLALSGATIARIYNIEEETTTMLQPDITRQSHLGSIVTCSSDALFASMTQSNQDRMSITYLLNDEVVAEYSSHLSASITEFSPNGYLTINNPVDAAHGAPSPFCGAPEGRYNLPLIVIRIQGR